MADESGGPRRFEPWPWGIAGLLAAMIGVCLIFLGIAIRNPDPVVSTPPAAEASR